MLYLQQSYINFTYINFTYTFYILFTKPQNWAEKFGLDFEQAFLINSFKTGPKKFGLDFKKAFLTDSYGYSNEQPCSGKVIINSL